MGEARKTTHKHAKSAVIGLGLIVLFFILTIEATSAAINVRYKNTILPGVSIGKINVGGLAHGAALALVQKEVDSIKQKGLTFCFEQYCTIIDALLIAPDDLDLAYGIIDTDITKVVEEALDVGKTGNHLTRVPTLVKTIQKGTTLSMDWYVDGEELENILKENFEERISRAKNAAIHIGDDGSVIVNDAIEGEKLEYNTAVKTAEDELRMLNSPQVIITASLEKPDIIEVDREKIIRQVSNAIENQKWELLHDNITWIVSRSDKQRLLSLHKNENGIVSLGIDENVFLGLVEGIAGSIEHPVQNAKFVLKDGRVTEFQNSQDGITIKKEETVTNAQSIIQKSESSKEVRFPIVVTRVESPVPTESINDLGIKELIGIGHSNFSGSPVNRRHNIRIGAETLHGLLIKPEEEFSLVNALGEVDARKGYRQELVIKGNRTIPEFGGGLCQIGTTSFRVALDAGLPITERKNHSYRVRYYEPAGTDATIYGPHPDFRFINDTGQHILIQTRIEGDDIYFEFWGTDDGRVSEQSKPVVYNITAPPPTKYIETLDLPVGKVNCTEHAIPGADTSFDYKVIYENGEEKKETFKSHYRAWQEVCLIGVEELTAENPDKNVETEVNENSEGETINSYN